jgi:hypothetical protein
MHSALRVIGFVLLVFGLLGLSGAGTSLASFSHGLIRVLTMPIMLGSIMLVGTGIYLTVKTGRMRREHEQRQREQAILSALRARGGRITAIELATSVGLGLTEAEKELDRLVAEGHGRSDLTEDFRKVYLFDALSER